MRNCSHAVAERKLVRLYRTVDEAVRRRSKLVVAPIGTLYGAFHWSSRPHSATDFDGQW